MPGIPSSDIPSFQTHLHSSTRILALLGAGLSASSGLGTFRGAGGYWRNHRAEVLATPQAFARDPGLVWQFYAYRRHLALKAKPNPGHYALAELARQKGDFVTLTQNVDGLSVRASHPSSQIHYLHGQLFDLHCSDKKCGYVDPHNGTDPLCPVLTVTPDFADPRPEDNSVVPPTMRHSGISPDDLPHCPRCKTALLRPGVVWFGESLPEDVIDAVETWIDESPNIDLMLVIGTSAQVWPAAGYIAKAKSKGARIAVVNMDTGDLGVGKIVGSHDWVFAGDAAKIVPQILESEIGTEYSHGN